MGIENLKGRTWFEEIESDGEVLYNEGWEVKTGIWYLNGKKQTCPVNYSDKQAIDHITKYVEQKTKYDMASEYNDLDIYQAADSIDLYSYQGTLYYNNKVIDEVEAIRYVRSCYGKEFDIDAIMRIIKAVRILHRLNEIPSYVMPTATPIDNGFRFNDTAYGLLHYWLFESKQKYIPFLMSEGGKGKSTFTNFLKCLFKGEYYSADTKFMNQFFASFIAGKRMICFNDCTSARIENMQILKQISGGDEVSIERKGEQAYSESLSGFLLFVGNEDLSYDILDSGNQKRFVNLPWENKLDKPDPKWMNYEWSDGEIAFQIELARNAKPIDFEKWRIETIKHNIKENVAILYDTYEEYNVSNLIKYKYSAPNFYQFWELAFQYYTEKEIESIRENNLFIKPMVNIRKAVYGNKSNKCSGNTTIHK